MIVTLGQAAPATFSVYLLMVGLVLFCFWTAQGVLCLRDWFVQPVIAPGPVPEAPLVQLEQSLEGQPLGELSHCPIGPDCPGVGLRDLLVWPVCLLLWLLLFLFWPMLVASLVVDRLERRRQPTR